MPKYSEHDLIALIYEAAFDGQLWPTMLEEIANQIGARHIFLGIHDLETGAESIAPRTDPGHLHDYNEHWVDKNPCVSAMIAAPVGKIFHTPGELTDGEAYRRSEIFNEWCRPGDMGYGAMCVALNRDARRHAFTSVYKAWGVDSFQPEERALYARLVQHIARAIDLQRRVLDLRNELGAALGAMQALDDGVVVTDASGRILLLGGTAPEILPTVAVIAEAGATFAPPGHADKVRHLIGTCASRWNGHQMGGTLSVPRESQSDLKLTIMPFPSNRSGVLWLLPGAPPAATIILADPDLQMKRSRGRLASVYGLTPAEVRFAAEIAKGDGKRRAAERCGISYATARAHLSSIFEKTGVHRQAELVRLLVGG